MLLSRKDFIKTLGAGVGTALIYVTTSRNRILAAASSLKIEQGAKVMLYDASKCGGCRACQTACKRCNKLPAELDGNGNILNNPNNLSERTWTLINVTEINNGGEKERLFRKCQCMHCINASCESVCPTGAISHQGNAVIINQEWCIGCGYCVQACPFGVPHKDEENGTACKCTFCVDRTTQGLEPACVEACPRHAVIYGDKAQLITEGEKRVQTLIANGMENANLYGDTELGGLGVIYVLPESPTTYGLPEEPRLATTNVAAQWLSGIVTAGFIVAIPFWLVFKQRREIG